VTTGFANDQLAVAFMCVSGRTWVINFSGRRVDFQSRFID
jgi:hypothetical protein